jgi:hypothetical protein
VKPIISNRESLIAMFKDCGERYVCAERLSNQEQINDLVSGNDLIAGFNIDNPYAIRYVRFVFNDEGYLCRISPEQT